MRNATIRNPPEQRVKVYVSNVFVCWCVLTKKYDDNSPQDQEREVSNKTFEGSHVGRINALTENKHIRKENRKAMLHNRNEAQSIGLGNQIAKQRDREGFDSRNYRVEEEALRQQNKQREEEAKRIKDAGKGKDDGANGVTKEEGGGYQCEEYNMTTYDGMEYESNYEYKSVYD